LHCIELLFNTAELIAKITVRQKQTDSLALISVAVIAKNTFNVHDNLLSPDPGARSASGCPGS
jgi:hypothetical protein